MVSNEYKSALGIEEEILFWSFFCFKKDWNGKPVRPSGNAQIIILKLKFNVV